MVDYRSPVDCKYIIAEKQEEINELGRAVVVVIDIPRSVSMDRAELYTLLECIKDGSFVSTKYKPTAVKLEKQPHVLVCSNKPLDVRNMSPDKFNPFIITSDFELAKNEALLEAQLARARLPTAALFTGSGREAEKGGVASWSGRALAPVLQRRVHTVDLLGPVPETLQARARQRVWAVPAWCCLCVQPGRWQRRLAQTTQLTRRREEGRRARRQAWGQGQLTPRARPTRAPPP